MYTKSGITQYPPSNIEESAGRVLRQYHEKYMASPMRSEYWMTAWMDDHLAAILEIEVPTDMESSRQQYRQRLIAHLSTRERSGAFGIGQIDTQTVYQAVGDSIAPFNTTWIAAVVGSLAAVNRYAEESTDQEKYFDPLGYVMNVSPPRYEYFMDPICAAASAGNLEILQYLLSRVEELNRTRKWDRDSMSQRIFVVVRVASGRGHDETVRALYNFGRRHKFACCPCYPCDSPIWPNFLTAAPVSGCINTV
jgi:hypothetical protein